MARALAALLSAPLIAGATPGGADILKAISYTGSEALVTHVLSLPGMPAGAAGERLRFEAARGYRAVPGVTPQRDFRIRPTLSLDPNVNGGLPNDSLTVSGLTFDIDPEFVGKSDILVGLEAFGAVRENIAPGLALDLRGRAWAAYAPRSGAVKSSIDMSACLRQQANASLYLHGCAGLEYRYQELGEQTVLNGSFGVSQAFGQGAAVHAVTAEVGLRHFMPGGGRKFSQAYGRLSTASALQNGTAILSQIEIGQKVERAQVTRLRASVTAIREVYGRPTSLGLFYSKTDGSIFLGSVRKDHNLGLAATRQMNDRITLTATLTQTRSNADLFNTGPSLGLNMQISF